MRLRPLHNFSEARASDQLERALGSSWHIGSKVRVGDVIQPDGEDMPAPCRSMLHSGHFDFLIATRDEKRPVLGIELDGPTHRAEPQRTRDRAKNALCVSAGLPLIRLPLDALDPHEQITALEWFCGRFAACQQARPRLRRTAQKRWHELGDDGRSDWIELYGSESEARRAMDVDVEVTDPELEKWRGFPPVTVVATRLWETYSIAPDREEFVLIEHGQFGRHDAPLVYRLADDENDALTLSLYRPPASSPEAVFVASIPYADESETIEVDPVRIGRFLVEGPPKIGSVYADPHYYSVARHMMAAEVTLGETERSVAIFLAQYATLRQLEGWAQRHLVSVNPAT